MYKSQLGEVLQDLLDLLILNIWKKLSKKGRKQFVVFLLSVDLVLLIDFLCTIYRQNFGSASNLDPIVELAKAFLELKEEYDVEVIVENSLKPLILAKMMARDSLMGGEKDYSDFNSRVDSLSGLNFTKNVQNSGFAERGELFNDFNNFYTYRISAIVLVLALLIFLLIINKKKVKELMCLIWEYMRGTKTRKKFV